MKTTLLITTYNWPEALELVLKSVQHQTQLPTEIVIADDGSGDPTKKIIDAFKKKNQINLKHIWQEDSGFRKSAILNKAIVQTNSDYIIQIDGDCILHKDFIKDHISSAKKDLYLFGSRVTIKQDALPELFKNKICEFPFFSKNIKKRTRNLRIPIFRDRYTGKPTFSSKTRGCNLSYWKTDFIAVNGYNEDMEGWGREDSEFVLRMLNNGVQGKRLRYGGVLYHIYHTESSKANLPENNLIQEKTIEGKKTWCENGIDKYLKNQ